MWKIIFSNVKIYPRSLAKMWNLQNLQISDSFWEKNILLKTWRLAPGYLHRKYMLSIYFKNRKNLQHPAFHMKNSSSHSALDYPPQITASMICLNFTRHGQNFLVSVSTNQFKTQWEVLLYFSWAKCSILTMPIEFNHHYPEVEQQIRYRALHRSCHTAIVSAKLWMV